jgi:tRNA/tmRNA/rRNA uracil-C5-methylase (TrmA/RlmC/RlmD family)
VSCPHRPPCPGCPRYGEAGLPRAGLARLAELAHELGAPPPEAFAGAPFGFRHRARLAVRGRARSPKLGLFREGTHQIVDIPRCELHHPALNALAADVKAAIREVGARPYSDSAHAGDVRYLQGVVERGDRELPGAGQGPHEGAQGIEPRADARVQVVIVGLEREPVTTAPLLDRLTEQLGDRLQGLFFNGQPERSNSIIGPHWQAWAGEPAVIETIGGARVFFPPGAFGQANLALFDRVVTRIHGWVPDGARVLECYAGVGAIGLGLAGRVDRLSMNERSPHGLAGMAMGIAALDEVARGRIAVLEGSAEITARELDGASVPDVVIVDPPRKGLGRGLRGALSARPPARLVYLSCGLESFLADARALAGTGPLRLARLEAWGFLPYTEHVEVLARFDRR